MSTIIIAPEKSGDLIWYMDPQILISKPLDYFPTRYDSIESKLNKILKLSIYCGLVLTVIEGDVAYLLIPIVFAIFSYLLYSEAVAAPGIDTAVINPIDPATDSSTDGLENTFLKSAQDPDYDEGCAKTTPGQPFYFPSLLNCARNRGKAPEDIVDDFKAAVGPSPLGLPTETIGPNVPVVHATLSGQGDAYRYVAGLDLRDLQDRTILNNSF